MTWDTSSSEETQALAMEVFSEALARNPTTPIILLSGELGVGKTTFAQALAGLLCVEGTVTSPTFTIERRYETRHEHIKKFIHLDLYRISDPDEMHALHLDETLQLPHTLVVVEWPEHGAFAFPTHAVHVSFIHNGGDKRHISLV